MRIQIQNEGAIFEKELSTRAPNVIGRNEAGNTAQIDIGFDRSISRRHAQIWHENGQWWIKDLGSRTGTRVNGVGIKAESRRQLNPGDVAVIGKAELRLQSDQQPSDPPESAAMTTAEGEFQYFSASAENVELPASEQKAALLLRAIHNLAVALTRGEHYSQICKTLMNHLRELVPSADHIALLMPHSASTDLRLIAHEPAGDPRVSTRLAWIAINQREGIVWGRAVHGMPNESIASLAQHDLENVLCAPLIWQNEVVGAVWLSGSGESAFTPADLSLVVVLANHVAMSLAWHKAQADQNLAVDTLKHVMVHFSPKVAGRLMEQAREGKLRRGGKKSQVTVLCADLRGFTKATAQMVDDDVVDMLNAYFAQLVPVIHHYGGTVDKFIGDAILAVFGSPEPDVNQYTNAVQAAREMQRAMRQNNKQREAIKLPVLGLGIGIHCGLVLHGFVGSEDRVEFTVIGDAVNKTSRYCDGAGPGQVIISPELYEIVWQKVKAQRTDIQTKHEGALPAYVLVDV